MNLNIVHEENNNGTLVGTIRDGFHFSHSIHGKNFYRAEMYVDRLSGNVDLIPIMVTDRIVDVNSSFGGRRVMAIGQFRSYNLHEGDKSSLVLYFFAQEIKEDYDFEDTNRITLNGYICKTPKYRKTPFGREICDILIAVNRLHGKSDYIPCIAWGRTAKRAASLGTGTKILIVGRIQSREYTKKMSNGEEEKRIAYEVSISDMDLSEGESREDLNEH